MKTSLLRTIKRIQRTKNLLTLKEILIEVKKELNFKYVFYSIHLPKSFTETSSFIISNYPEKWLQRYTEKTYIKIDPVVQECTKTHIPYCWDQTIDCKNPIALNIMKEAADHDLSGGISIGSLNYEGGINFLSFATNHVVKTGSEQCSTAALYLLALHPYLDEVIIKLYSKLYSNGEKTKLTKREIECLSGTIVGKSSREIAELLSITSPTVVFHLKNVIRKLNVKNRNEAIAQAILLGIISPLNFPSSTFDTYHF